MIDYEGNIYDYILIGIMIDVCIIGIFLYCMRVTYERNRDIEQQEELNII